MYKHDEQMDKGKIKLISFISFLMGFFQALFIYIISTYFKQASGTENISLFYLAAYTVILIIFLNLHKVVRKLGKSNIFYFSLMLKIFSIACLLIFPPSPLAVMALILYIIAGSAEWLSIDIILESFSVDNMSGRIRGKYLTIMNAGFLLGPFISARIVSQFNYRGIFITLLFANCLLFIISLLSLREINHKFDAKLGILDLIRKVWKRKNILRIYQISFTLEFFYALAIIYTPIYLLNLGLSWGKIGLIFTVMLIPFVILQYPFGLLADKKMGEKEIIVFSIFVMALSTGAIYFIGSAGVFIWSLVLFFTRVGASILEIMRDSYFYKRIDGHDVDLINFFRTAQSMAYIVSSVIAFCIFRFSPANPIKTIFIVIVIALLMALFPALRLVDNKCEREMANC